MDLRAGPQGILLPEAGLALDDARPGLETVVSHAHADHVPRGVPRAHCTPETAAFLALRAPEIEAVPRAWGEPFRAGEATVAFHPSGHVLGAALVEVRHAGATLLYTGDVKLREPFTCPPCARGLSADVLVVESTFGLPVFAFPPARDLAERAAAFARETLAEGATPVFLGYNLGKAQEVARALGTSGVDVQMHGAAWNLARVYADFGVELPRAEPYDPATLPGKALVVPPSARASPMVTNLRDPRVAYASGWAALESSRHERGADLLLPLSDHADFPALLDLVRDVGAPEVVCTHGYSDAFAHVLRGEGFDARAVHAGRFDEDEAREAPA